MHGSRRSGDRHCLVERQGIFLGRCLRSVDASLHGSSLTYRIVVVDNASRDGTPQMVKNEFPDVLLIENTSICGFRADPTTECVRLGSCHQKRDHGVPHAICYCSTPTPR